MILLKSIFDFILYCNLYVALGFTCLAFQTFEIAAAGKDYSLLLFIFFSSVFVYCFHRSYGLIGSKEAIRSDHLRWIKSHKKMMILVFTFLLPAIFFCCFQLTVSHVIAIVPVALLSLGYTIPVIPAAGGNITLRDIPGLKIFIISFVISYVTVMLPLISAWEQIPVSRSEMTYLFIKRFFFLFAITLPFDIRDLESDKIKEVKTIPSMMGVDKSKYCAYAAIALFVIINMIHYSSGHLPLMPLLAMSVSMLPAVVFVHYSSAARSEYYYSLGVESMMIIQPLLVALAMRM